MRHVAQWHSVHLLNHYRQKYRILKRSSSYYDIYQSPLNYSMN